MCGWDETWQDQLSVRKGGMHNAQKITMADIADMAGVTKSTVSRFFNGGSVGDATRQKIQEIIREYNYEPNTFARLKARESNVAGVVVPSLNSKNYQPGGHQRGTLSAGAGV